MNKRLLLVSTAILLIDYVGICQQSSSITSNTLDFVQNREIFLNSAMNNPTQLTDSNKIYLDLIVHDQWSGPAESNNGLFVKVENGILPHDMSSGLVIDFKKHGLFKHRSIIGSIKKGLSIGSNSGLDFGLNFGLWQSRMDVSDIILQQPDPLIDENKEWTNSLVLDFGVSFNFKSQSFGLSYKNIINSAFEIGSYDYILRLNGLIVNYQGFYSLSDSFTLSPELLGCFTSESNNAVIACRISFKRVITCGLLYNTNDSFGFILSGIIIKRVKIGYYFDINNEKVYNDQTVGSHGLNAGFIFN
ncbi:MAG: type IX secretion system membrane protein PorP/SprF [Bacteroidales bacterium]|nr:MAG: type IX secretion system membrane protein PorP/SprF [Bacteroidales bacterium]